MRWVSEYSHCEGSLRDHFRRFVWTTPNKPLHKYLRWGLLRNHFKWLFVKPSEGSTKRCRWKTISQSYKKTFPFNSVDELSTPSDYLFAANEDCAMSDWCWCINTDELLSSIKLYPCCRLFAWQLADQRLSTCFDVRRRIVPSSNCMSYYLKGSVCLTAPFRPIIHWSVGALGSALSFTLDSNHALSNLRTAWQYSQMSYTMLHYIDLVNALNVNVNAPT